MKRVFILSISIMIILSITLAGCQSGNSQNSSEINSNQGSEEEMTKTSNYLVKNGTTEYVIVLPTNPTKRELTAANELQFFFNQATGYRLPIYRENESINGNPISYSKDSQYLVLGDTEISKQLNLVPDYEEFGQQGFVIKTKDKNIIMRGNKDFGTLYSVYEFLSLTFNYDFFTENVFTIEKNCKEKPLYEYDSKEIPDIKAMEQNYGYINYNQDTANRLRMTKRSDVFLPVNSMTSVHSMLNIMPRTTYTNEDYYYKNSAGRYNLCATAHGNQDSYKQMVEDFANELKEEMLNGELGNAIVFGQSDGVEFCKCPSCTASAKAKGANSGVLISFCNDVLQNIRQWFEEDGKDYKREFYILVLAYQSVEEAPEVTLDTTNQQYIMKDGTPIDKNIGVILAPIAGDFTQSIKSKRNETIYNTFYSWSKIASVFAFYGYDMYFGGTEDSGLGNFLVPFNSLSAKQELYSMLKDVNCISMFDEGCFLNSGLPTGWSMLKAYIESKLRWNVNCDINVLIDKYFQGVYGKAGDTVKSIFNSYRVYWKSIELAKQNNLITCDFDRITSPIINVELWKQNTLNGWVELFDKAEKEIEELKDLDINLYNQISKYIAVERMSYVYLLAQLYEKFYSDRELLELRQQLYKDWQQSRLTYLRENGSKNTFEYLFSSWGLI